MVMLRSAMKALHSGRYSQWHPMSRNEDPHAASGASLSTALLGFLAFLAGATVANLYYSQPLLTRIAASFHIAPGRAGLVTVATQIGYAAGLMLIVPLGDGQERKRLIITTTGLIAGALALVALSPTLPILLAACLFIRMRGKPRRSGRGCRARRVGGSMPPCSPNPVFVAARHCGPHGPCTGE